MKRRFCLVPAAIALVCTEAAFANDIENAINKYGGKIGIKGSAASLINSQIKSVAANGATTSSGAASATGAGLNSTTTTTTTATAGTTTTRASSLKNALQKVFSKSKTTASTTSTTTSTATSTTTNTATAAFNQLNTGLPAAVPPSANLVPKKQSVKAKIGKEIWRQAKRYETKHPNKLMHTGVNSLNKVVQP